MTELLQDKPPKEESHYAKNMQEVEQRNNERQSIRTGIEPFLSIPCVTPMQHFLS